MKQDLRRLQEERDADHSALRTAVQLSGHLVLGGGHGGASSSSAHGGGGAEIDAADEVPIKGKGKEKGKKGKGKGGKKGGRKN